MVWIRERTIPTERPPLRRLKITTVIHGTRNSEEKLSGISEAWSTEMWIEMRHTQQNSSRECWHMYHGCNWSCFRGHKAYALIHHTNISFVNSNIQEIVALAKLVWTVAKFRGVTGYTRCYTGTACNAHTPSHDTVGKCLRPERTIALR
jgi:hypothetical protein